MALNWFEGGRRIVLLVAGIILLGGTGYLFLGDSDKRVTLETSSPDERLHWTLKECNYPAFEKEWDGQSTFLNGEARQMVACFRAKANGKIEYAYGPEQSIPFPDKPGQKPLPPMKIRKVLDADPFSDEVQAYALERMRGFNLTYEEMSSIGSGMWKIGVARFCERAVAALPWIVGLIIGLWVLASGIGWLVRGFAGIPQGHDFKADDLNNASRSYRAPLDWLWSAIGGWFVVSAIGWLVLKAMTPATTAFGKFASKAFHSVGMIIMAVIGFAVAAGGAVALRTLFYELIKREAPVINGDDDTRMLIVFGFANGIILAIFCWLVTTYTIVGGWVNGLDQWSRSNGFADGGTVGLFVLCLLWPVIPLLVITRAKRSKSGV